MTTSTCGNNSTAGGMRLCVTGGIACGKSLVGSFLEQEGLPVIEADQVCHQLLGKGAPLFEAVVAAFGKTFIQPDGEIDRVALGRLVFADERARQKLNDIMHPVAQREIAAWVQRQFQNKAGASIAVAAIIPLVYEVNWAKAWDRVICVAAPASQQVQRLCARGLSLMEAQNRLAAQWPIEEKINLADHVIFSVGSPACARQQTINIVKQIKNQMEKRNGR
jgi:dephospho-CoA kinase